MQMITPFLLVLFNYIFGDHPTGGAHRLGGVMENVRGRNWTNRHDRRRDPDYKPQHWNHIADEDSWRVPAWLERLLAARCSSCGGRRRMSQELELLLGIQSADQVGAKGPVPNVDPLSGINLFTFICWQFQILIIRRSLLQYRKIFI